MSSESSRPPLPSSRSKGSGGSSAGNIAVSNCGNNRKSGSGGSSGGGSSGGGSSGGSGGPRKSSANNPSSRGDNHHGFAVTSSNLRPATHTKVGYPLLCFLNRKKCGTDQFPTISEGGELQPASADGLLNEVYGNWVRAGQKAAKEAEEAAAAKAKAAEEAKAEEKKEKENKQVGEKDLTEALATKMEETLGHIDDACLRVRPEVHVKMKNPDMTGKVDILVQDREGSPVLMIEAGLLNDDWWKKLDQGLMYVPGLKNFTKPFLFVVLTMDVKRDDPDNIQGGRMGAFLVTPRSEGDNPRLLAKFRMTLLWRDETTDLKQFSKHFGRILRATCLLPKWNAAPSTYHYLGPSCCRIGENEVSVCSC
jgi:hypothetical protein